jgi:hypothetical protein
MFRVTVSIGAAVLAGRRWPPGGRPGTAGWDVCHPARDEAGLTDMVLLGWSGYLPTARDAASSMLPGVGARVKGRLRCMNVTIDERIGAERSLCVRSLMITAEPPS